MPEPIFLISGFGRCGTGLAMQMLQAGGFPVTGEWPAFEDHFAELTHASEWTADAWTERFAGKAVKLLDPQRAAPPMGPTYRALWLDRDHHEQAKSQVKFMQVFFALAESNRETVRRFQSSYRRDRPRAIGTLATRGSLKTYCFENLLRDPPDAARMLQAFVGRGLDTAAMAAVVRKRDPSCYPGMLEGELLAERGL